MNLFSENRFRMITGPACFRYLLGIAAGLILFAGCRREAPEQTAAPGACTVEFSYTLGTIDARFGIDRQEVQAAVDRALGLWSGAVDDFRVKNTSNAPNTIRFIYDDRQARSDLAGDLQERIEAENDRLSRLKSQYEREKIILEHNTAAHQKLADRVAAELETFNRWANRINRAGGFTEDRIPEYERRKQAVERLQESEQQSRTRLTRSVREFNRLADRLNREVESHARMVAQFNERFGDAYHFEGAVYEGDGRRGTLTIYHFEDPRELTVLLAHEIGHALGMGHVENSRSIMFPTIADQLDAPETELSSEDRAEIKKRCS